METVREAQKQVASAYALNPDSTTATLQRFSLHCITLNFKDALKDPIDVESSLGDYLLLAEAFPAFNFTESHRPTVEQLTEFLQEAREINPNRKALMERIVAYDHAVRGRVDDYRPVVEALVSYVDNNASSISEFSQDGSTLLLRWQGNIRLTIWDKWGSNECLLRFLNFRTLKMEVEGRFYPGDLQNLPVETLDLSGCQTLVFNHTVDLPLLRRLIIRPGQITPAELRASIHSNEPFEIVE